MSDYNGFRGGHNILKLLYVRMENLSVTGFREPEIQDICFLGNRRFPGMSVRLSAKTEGRAQPPEIGASPESVIIREMSMSALFPSPVRCGCSAPV
ncbi:Uncharacterized protein dnm_095830 [Desulfonema magnum]|uniref:Uncharacterized protein n=1 Tax=Desulfonema magnum TaxID=45655 RepID=A0A975BXT5_9BACT|nr:Uncharacterized protein dnm_095830 [Desulfonema magnum]